MRKYIVWTFLVVLLLIILGQFLFIYYSAIDEGRESRTGETTSLLEDAADRIPTKDNETRITLPAELVAQKEVSDVTVRETSIADMPDVWRAFFYSDLPISDPSFILGCEEYLDTGSTLIADIFTDESGGFFVAEVTEGQLIGVGEITKDQLNLIVQYSEQDAVIGCLELLKRDYVHYSVVTPRVSFDNSEGVGQLLLSGVPAPLSEDVEKEVMDTIDAEVIGTDLVYISERGILFFDLKTWEEHILQEVYWEGLWALSNLVYDKEYGRVLYAIQEWDDEDAEVVVYHFSPEDSSYETFVTNAELAWQIGTSAHARLEFSSDLLFNDEKSVELIKRPEFFLQVAEGVYPPDAGTIEVLEWIYR